MLKGIAEEEETKKVQGKKKKKEKGKEEGTLKARAGRGSQGLAADPVQGGQGSVV